MSAKALATLTHEGTIYRLVTHTSSKESAIKIGTRMEREGWDIVVVKDTPHEFGVYAGLKMNPRWPKGLTPTKARKILHEGISRGKRLTEKQRRMFGARASGYPKKNFFPPLSHTKEKKLVLYVPEIGEFVHDHKQAMKEAKKNPALNVFGLVNPPHSAGGLMSDSVHEVRYTHRTDGEPYKHTFKKGVKMRANKDGTITLYHPTKRIWEEFPT